MGTIMKRRMIRVLCLCMMTAVLCLGNHHTKVADRKKTASETVEERKVASMQAMDRPMTMIGTYVMQKETVEKERTGAQGKAGVSGENGREQAAQKEDDGNEYADLAFANVSNYVNVRSLPSTDSEIVGKIYHGAVAQILETAGEDDEWFHVISGNVEGYIKAEYFIYGDAAADVIDDYVKRSVVVKADVLNVRMEADIESKRIGYLVQGESATLVENCGEWLKIQYTSSKQGYVMGQYVTVAEEFTYAKSIEEERAEKEALLALRRRENTPEQSQPENTRTEYVPPAVTFTSNEELRTEIVNYAKQFLGNRYVSGGKTLAGGTDCSGFTSLIYADFGYSIGRTPSSQYSSAGRSIDYSEIQPGDIICYSSNGGKSCTHVGIYIGDGQIIHSANSRKGVVIYEAGYDKIIGVRNVID